MAVIPSPVGGANGVCWLKSIFLPVAGATVSICCNNELILVVESALFTKYKLVQFVKAGKDKDESKELETILISQLDKEGKLKEVKLGILDMFSKLQLAKLFGGVKLAIALTINDGQDVKRDKFKLARLFAWKELQVVSDDKLSEASETKLSLIYILPEDSLTLVVPLYKKSEQFFNAEKSIVVNWLYTGKPFELPIPGEMEIFPDKFCIIGKVNEVNEVIPLNEKDPPIVWTEGKFKADMVGW